MNQVFKQLAERTQSVSQRFNDAGFSLYLVGGIVRDALLDRIKDETDFDCTTNALPDQTEKVVSGFADDVWLQGKRFGTVGFRVGQDEYEVTTHRAEAYDHDSRKPNVEFSDSIEADLSRRDFTVNAMALSLPELELVDPFDGQSDLENRVLRTPLQPEVSFADDPLRMMRAARFLAGYDLIPEETLVRACVEMRERLSIVSRERIRDELDKLLVVEKPSDGLWFLSHTQLSDEFLPELNALALEQDPVHHHKDVLAHTIAVVDNAPPRRRLRLACLMHDIGKPKTRAIKSDGVSFYNHDVVGARMTRKRMTELKYANEDIDDVSKLVELHLRFYGYEGQWSDSAVRRYVRDAGNLLQDLNDLVRADCTTQNRNKAQDLYNRVNHLEVRIEELRKQEELDSIRPELNGNEIMEILGLEPGKTVGEASKYLLEVRLDEGILGRDVIERRLQEWYAAR